MKSRLLTYYLIASVVLVLGILTILYPPEFWTPELLISLGWIAGVAVLLWFGIRFMTRKLDKTYPWKQYGRNRLFLQLSVIITYSLAIVNGAYFLLRLFFIATPPRPEQVFVMNVYGTLIILFVTSIYFLFYFLRAWIKSQIEGERLKKESVQAQLHALRNHLDPHFLFNNLNILSALIDQDNEKSQLFLSKFSEVYRVLLQTESDELIPLRQELEFVQAYLHLLHIRFGDLFQVEINIPTEVETGYVPPLTLQMLLENALKHNQVNEDHPLVIRLDVEGNHLLVSNPLLPKTQEVKTIGSGLNNLTERYRMLTDLELEVQQTDTHFTVKVPLIQLDEDERTDS